MSASALWADTATELAALSRREHTTQHEVQDAMERAATVVRDLGMRVESAEAALQIAGWSRCPCGRWYARKNAETTECLMCWVGAIEARKARAA